MFTTIRQYELQTGTMKDVLEAVQNEFVPEITAVNGFVAYHVLDAGTKLLTITTFETEAGVKESDRRAAKFVTDRPTLARAILSRQATVGEVRVSRMAERTSGAYTR